MWANQMHEGIKSECNEETQWKQMKDVITWARSACLRRPPSTDPWLYREKKRKKKKRCKEKKKKKKGGGGGVEKGRNRKKKCIHQFHRRTAEIVEALLPPRFLFSRARHAPLEPTFQENGQLKMTIGRINLKGRKNEKICHGEKNMIWT